MGQRFAVKQFLIAFLLLLPFHAEAIIFVAGTANTTNAGAITSFALPTNLANDIIILAIQSNNETISVSTGGYTEIDTQANMAVGTAGPLAAGSTRLAVYWKRSAGSEATVSINDSGDHTMVTILIVRGCVTTGNPYDVEQSAVQATASIGVSWQSAGITYNGSGTLTTTVDAALVVGIIANGTDSGTSQTGAETVGTLNNVTEVSDINTATATGGGLGIFTGIKPSAGVVLDTSSFNASASLVGSSKYVMFFMALKPATGGPQYIGSNTFLNSAGSLTVTLAPLIYAANDILVLVVETGGGSPTTPSGWTLFGGSASTLFGTSEAVGSGKITTFWLRATSSSETDPNIGDSGSHQIAQVFAFRNCIASGTPTDVKSEGSQATTNTAANWQSAGFSYDATDGSTITTTTANDLVIAIVANGIDSATSQTSSQVSDSLSNFIAELSDVNTSNTNGGGFSVSIGDMPTAGNVVIGSGAPNFTAAFAATSKYGIQIIALKPTVSGPTAQQKAAFFNFFGR